MGKSAMYLQVVCHFMAVIPNLFPDEVASKYPLQLKYGGILLSEYSELFRTHSFTNICMAKCLILYTCGNLTQRWSDAAQYFSPNSLTIWHKVAHKQLLGTAGTFSQAVCMNIEHLL